MGGRHSVVFKKDKYSFFNGRKLRKKSLTLSGARYHRQCSLDQPIIELREDSGSVHSLPTVELVNDEQTSEQHFTRGCNLRKSKSLQDVTEEDHTPIWEEVEKREYVQKEDDQALTTTYAQVRCKKQSKKPPKTFIVQEENETKSTCQVIVLDVSAGETECDEADNSCDNETPKHKDSYTTSETEVIKDFLPARRTFSALHVSNSNDVHNKNERVVRPRTQVFNTPESKDFKPQERPSSDFGDYVFVRKEHEISLTGNNNRIPVEVDTYKLDDVERSDNNSHCITDIKIPSAVTTNSRLKTSISNNIQYSLEKAVDENSNSENNDKLAEFGQELIPLVNQSNSGNIINLIDIGESSTDIIEGIDNHLCGVTHSTSDSVINDDNSVNKENVPSVGITRNNSTKVRLRNRKRIATEPPPLPPRTVAQQQILDNAFGTARDEHNALTDIMPLPRKPVQPVLPLRPFSVTDGRQVKKNGSSVLVARSASMHEHSTIHSDMSRAVDTSQKGETINTKQSRLEAYNKKRNKAKSTTTPMQKIETTADDFTSKKNSIKCTELDMSNATVEIGPKVPPRKPIKSVKKKQYKSHGKLPSTPLGPHEKEESPPHSPKHSHSEDSDLMCLLKVPLRVKGKTLEREEVVKKHTRDLLLAAQTGRTDYVRTLLNQTNIDVNVEDSDGWTPLHHACKSGNPETVILLIERGASVGQASHSGSEPLIIALLEKHKEETMRKWHQRDVAQIVHELVYRGADVNLVEPSGMSTLMIAISVENNYTIDYLLDNGVDVNFPVHLSSLLHAVTLQVSRGIVWLEIERKLLERGADPNVENCSGQVPASLLFYSEFCEYTAEDVKHYDDNTSSTSAWSKCDISWEKYIELPVVLRLAKPNQNTFGYTKKRLARFLRHMRAGLNLWKIPQDILVTVDRILSMERNVDVLCLFHACGHCPNTEMLREETTGSGENQQKIDRETLREFEELLNAPTTLMQLAANAIRVSVKPNVHVNVQHLPIPNILKPYITLDAYDGIKQEHYTQGM